MISVKPRSEAEVFVTDEGERIEIVQRYPDGDCLYYCDGTLMVGPIEEVHE